MIPRVAPNGSTTAALSHDISRSSRLIAYSRLDVNNDRMCIGQRSHSQARTLESKPSGSRQRYGIAYSNRMVAPCEWLLQILSRSMFAALQRFARYSLAENLDSLGLLQQAQKVLSLLHPCC